MKITRREAIAKLATISGAALIGSAFVRPGSTSQLQNLDAEDDRRAEAVSEWLRLVRSWQGATDPVQRERLFRDSYRFARVSGIFPAPAFSVRELDRELGIADR